MKTKFFGLVLVLTLVGALGGAMATSASATHQDVELLPSTTHRVPAHDVAGDESLPETSATTRTEASQAQGPIIIDHTCTDLSKVPDYWLNEAKKLAFHYAHTSHGSQINSGLQALEQQDPKYDYDIFTAGSSPPTSLNCDPGALCIYDGNPPETYIQPDDYWSTESGRNRTRAVADTGLFDYSMWSWCGQQSSNPTSTVQLYLDTLTGFEQEYLDMRFILMTGHTDGGGATLARNNNMVKQYAIDNEMVLFDFADIETYDPLDGGPYVNNGEGNCTWCVDFCADHPEYCTHLPDSCAHSSAHPEDRLFCKLKGHAFWWMMARIAGWSGTGSQKTASPDTAIHGQTITYTVVVRDTGAPLTATVYLTDEVPSGLAYVSGAITATAGTVNDDDAPILRWSGVLTPTPAVTVTYAVTVSATAPQTITNSAIIAAPGYPPITSTATVVVELPYDYPDLTPSYKAVSSRYADYSERITYTVGIRNATGPLPNTVLFTDTIQEGLSYVAGTLTATTGIVTDTDAPTLRWSGLLTPTSDITITYIATVTHILSGTTTVILPQVITNTAIIAAPGYQTVTRTATVRTNWHNIYLPVVLRNSL